MAEINKGIRLLKVIKYTVCQRTKLVSMRLCFIYTIKKYKIFNKIVCKCKPNSNDVHASI